MSEPVLSPDDVDAALAEQGLAWERVGDELVTTVELRDFDEQAKVRNLL